jgi:hypothetical protein
MPYLEPDQVLERFSGFALEEIRPAVDDEFLAGQIGSLASTLRFLSMELAGRADAIERQHGALTDALRAVDETVENEAVGLTVETALDQLADVSNAEPGEIEPTLLAASNDVFDAIEENLSGDAARRARAPLYGFLETRVQTQLELMGRERQ